MTLNAYHGANLYFSTNGTRTTVSRIDTGETVRATTDQELDNLIIKLCSIIKRN